MTFTQALFSFRGRLGRLPYLGYMLLAVAVGSSLAAAFALGAMYLHSQRGAMGIVIGLALLGALCILPMIWSAWAITAKRLHDMGLSAWHLIWVLGAPYAISVLALLAPNPTIELGLAVWYHIFTLGLLCWLLFWRGEPSANAWGPPPGAPVVTPSGYPNDYAPEPGQPLSGAPAHASTTPQGTLDIGSFGLGEEKGRVRRRIEPILPVPGEPVAPAPGEPPFPVSPGAR